VVALGATGMLGKSVARGLVRNGSNRKLGISTVPLWPRRVPGIFSRKSADLRSIIDALDEYPYTFRAKATWNELGKPAVTTEEFARRT